MSMSMQPPVRRNRPEAPPGRKRRHREEATPPTDPAYLYLAALGAEVNVSDALHRPLVSELLVEDMCWRTAKEAWLDRRPRRFQRTARKAWRADGALLDEKRDRIRQLAAEQGITAKPRVKSRKERWWDKPA